jgi:hypothetical protein
MGSQMHEMVLFQAGFAQATVKHQQHWTTLQLVILTALGTHHYTTSNHAWYAVSGPTCLC